MSTFTIHNSMTLKELQEAFNSVFPYLKLEFFIESHKVSEGSPKRLMVPGEWDETITIADIQPKSQVVEFVIDSDITVARLEEYLETYFGLHAQVFRLAGDTWLETTRTDEWSLAEQNHMGVENDPTLDSHTNPFELKERPER